MNLLNNNIIDLQLLKNCIKQPEIFTKSTDKFWDDEHISAQMLNLHLNTEVESASKTKETIEAEADFIIKLTDMDKNKTVLDLGCGPGLYVREFAKTGAQVTGVDISERSINYANENIKSAFKNVDFVKMNYLELDCKEKFDIATLIFYDFGALNTDEQHILLARVHGALKDNGFFIFDVISQKKSTPTATSISVCEEGGFWSLSPYIEILHTCMYEKPKTEGLQYTIIDEKGATRVIRLYNRLFNMAEFTAMLKQNNFTVEKVYNNLKGEAVNSETETYGIIARKA